MKNLKKIGLSALAGSLVAVSASAGEMSVAGSAKMEVSHKNGGAASAGKSFAMGNQLTFSGSGELDNGMNVSLSFVLDQGDDETDTAAGASNSPFDSHSVTVSADGLGSLKFAGEGGDSAVAGMSDSVAGEMWDDYQASADEPESGKSSNDMLIYTLPTIVEGVDLAASYTPNGDGGADSSTSYSVEYTGIEGLTLAYGAGEDNSSTTTADATAWSVSYAYGPFSASLADLEYDHETATSDRDMSSYYVSYTVSDEISIGYGVEEITDGSGTEDAEFSGYDASYTAGGMTLSVAMSKGDNVDYSTTATKDQERWFLGASFAF